MRKEEVDSKEDVEGPRAEVFLKPAKGVFIFPKVFT
jgi:hypothetical protein